MFSYVMTRINNSSKLKLSAVHSRKKTMGFVIWARTFYVFVSITFSYFSTVTCDNSNFKRSSRTSYAQFVRNPNTKLTASSLATVQVSSLGECTLECVNHQECESVNFGKKDQEKHTCELINTDRFKVPNKLSFNQNFHHYNIKVILLLSRRYQQ